MEKEKQSFRRLPFRISVGNTNIVLVGRCFIPREPIRSFRPAGRRICRGTTVSVDNDSIQNSSNDVNHKNTTGGCQGPAVPLPSLSMTHLASNYIEQDAPVVVLVHQWSKMGGDSSLMDGIAIRLAADHGVPAVTFDLRGVGQSSGRATLRGVDEVQDVVAVCEWAAATLKAESIFLLGSSAGAPIAGSAVDLVKEVRGFIGVGYVFGFFASLIFSPHYAALINSKKPKLLIHGDKDGFTSLKKFTENFEKMAHPKEKFIVTGVGHFELEAPHYDSLIVKQAIRFMHHHHSPLPSADYAVAQMKSKRRSMSCGAASRDWSDADQEGIESVVRNDKASS